MALPLIGQHPIVLALLVERFQLHIHAYPCLPLCLRKFDFAYFWLQSYLNIAQFNYFLARLKYGQRDVGTPGEPSYQQKRAQICKVTLRAGRGGGGGVT